MTSDQAEAFKYNIFDLTKTWPFKNYPLRKFGKIVLNKNPENYFAEVEQLAFTPSNLVQGIEPSGDPVLQARLFTYPVALRHRLGVNFQQLPINRPLVPVANFQRDGPAAYENQGSRPNYPSSVCPLKYTGRPYEKKWLEDEQWWGYVNLDLSQITPGTSYFLFHFASHLYQRSQRTLNNLEIYGTESLMRRGRRTLSIVYLSTLGV